MKPIRILGIFSVLLGNRATANLLIQALQEIPNVELETLLVEAADYARYPAPSLARLTNPWHWRYVARKKFEARPRSPFDLLFLNAWEFAAEFRDLTAQVPAAVLMDAVPHTMDAQLRARGLDGWRRRMASVASSLGFGKAIRQCGYAFPMGSDCSVALREQYGFPEDRLFITLAPQRTDLWKPPATREARDSFRLLFVGNDFYRKGGAFLLDLFETSLHPRCSLTIVSGDPALEGKSLPKGVEWIRGKTKDELLEIYQQSDLFVFPTQQDFMPQVLAESLATGLPAIATDVGGIRDLVRTGHTGVLMPFALRQEDWQREILSLAADAARLERLRQGARAFAEQRLRFECFQQGIQTRVEQLMLGHS